MYAVVFQVDMKPDSQGDMDAELDQLVRIVKSQPGFVRATWTGDDQGRGLSFIVFESEEVARGMAANAGVPPDASVTFRSVDVYQVVRDVATE